VALPDEALCVRPRMNQKEPLKTEARSKLLADSGRQQLLRRGKQAIQISSAKSGAARGAHSRRKCSTNLPSSWHRTSLRPR
jgi:hypothetical protein